MTKPRTNSPTLRSDDILRWLAKMQSWSSFSGITRNRVKTLLEETWIHSLDDVAGIVSRTKLEWRKARSLQTSLGIVVAGLLKGKKPEEIMGDPNSQFQIWEHIKELCQDWDDNILPPDKRNSRWNPLPVDKILQRVSRF